MMASEGPPNKDGLALMWWSARHPPRDPTTSFTGKTVLITGANIGLGLEAAVKFAALGATRLVMGVRSIARGEAAKAEIVRRAGCDANTIQLHELDMKTFASVRAFAETVAAREPRLDIAVLNAGVAAPSHELSPEGFEMSVQVNVLSTALLAILLLPLLRRSAEVSGQPSHLEFVGSAAHRGVKPDTFAGASSGDGASSRGRILDLVSDKPFFAFDRQYHVSKLLLMYVVDGLVQSMSPSDSTNPTTTTDNHPPVIMTTVCPNLCRTNLGRDFSTLIKLPNYMFQLVFARTAEQGSRTLVSGAALGEDAMGEFWSHDVFDR